MTEMSDRRPNIFGLPPGVDFPATLVQGILDRHGDGPPENLARMTLFLNSARMLSSVRAAFDAKGARLLPKLRLVSDLALTPWPGLGPPAPALRRRLELAPLVGKLVGRLPQFAPGMAVFDLAESLARLMDEMQEEGVHPRALEARELVEDHAAHWERSLTFIRIVARYFEADSTLDLAGRQRRVIEALSTAWQAAPPSEPIIVAGSTGSRGATQLFMRTVARLPTGAVVLPGFDFDMTKTAWDSLATGTAPDEDHPQYRFRALTDALGATWRDVQPWTDTPAPDPARNRLLSLALRPAPVTDQWMAEGAALGVIARATERLALIEAPNPRAEALALALRLRQAAEDGTRAALITPDRTLARRVTAALDRWGILPDDSAGEPLNQSPTGRFLLQVAALLGRRLTSVQLLALLKHPITATGAGDRGTHLRLSRDLELDLRKDGPPFPDERALQRWAAARESAVRRPWADWLVASLGSAATVTEMTLSGVVETHLSLAGALAAGAGGSEEESELWRGEPGRLSRGVMAELRREASAGGTFGASDYAALLTNLLAAQNVRDAVSTHPLIAIRGTLEARAGDAELVLLAGLNDGTWPAVSPPDPWLSRQMRMKVGLTLPERQIGLSAHDFQQAAAAQQIVLSRALRDDEAETVPSRWLARITNLLDGLPAQGGPEALRVMRARGAMLLARAAAMEVPERSAPARRPAPRPPVEARPRTLAVTGISRLIRDPYSIYARHILRLFPLDPLNGTADARMRGETLHRIVERFVRGAPEGESIAAAEVRLLEVTDSILATDVPWPTAQRIWRARMARIAGNFVAAERRRAARGTPAILEKKGSIPLENGSLILTARPDRIDLLHDGRTHIYDYKSGDLPSKKRQKAFDKQLLLEAGMVERGAFPELGARQVEGVTHVRLGGDGEEATLLDEDGLYQETWQGLLKLAAIYADPRTGYTSRRAVFSSRETGDYDHLARFGEWDIDDPSLPVDVG